MARPTPSGCADFSVWGEWGWRGGGGGRAFAWGVVYIYTRTQSLRPRRQDWVGCVLQLDRRNEPIKFVWERFIGSIDDRTARLAIVGTTATCMHYTLSGVISYHSQPSSVDVVYFDFPICPIPTGWSEFCTDRTKYTGDSIATLFLLFYKRWTLNIDRFLMSCIPAGVSYFLVKPSELFFSGSLARFLRLYWTY